MALHDAAPNVPLGAVQTWGERFAKGAAVPRLLMTILVVFGGLAALLAALGVYGLFSWSVRCPSSAKPPSKVSLGEWGRAATHPSSAFALGVDVLFDRLEAFEKGMRGSR